MEAEPAPAKLNLALHVRARRPDGYHAIETAFAFCADGDTVEGELAPETTLEIVGPFAAVLSVTDNLVLRAAALMGVTARLRLVKRLPVASGVGGGSADSAATLRLLARLSDRPLPPAPALRALGADVPACVALATARGEGVGEALTPLPPVTGTPVLLVNPHVPLATAAVFAGWDGVDRGPLGDWRDGRNDLEVPARALVPAIGAVLDWLAVQPGATTVRMSGSGATCFALFDDVAARDAAAARVPGDWWAMASVLR